MDAYAVIRGALDRVLARARPPPILLPDAPTTEPAVRTTVIEVYKSPDCTCCHEWEAYLASRGYTVESVPTADMSGFKTDAGVPPVTWSCHTALVNGYVVEGHVPVRDGSWSLVLGAIRPNLDRIASAMWRAS